MGLLKEVPHALSYLLVVWGTVKEWSSHVFLKKHAEYWRCVFELLMLLPLL